MVSHWSLSDNKSPQVSRILLIIQADLNNAVVSMVSTRPSISKSISPFINPSVIVPRAPIKIGINDTFTFHSFFNYLARSRYLSCFSLSFNFTLRSAKSTIRQALFLFFSFFFLFFFFFWLLQDLVVWSRLSDPFLFQNYYYYHYSFSCTCLGSMIGQGF